MTRARDSFEQLDIDALEAADDGASGPRRLPGEGAPRGVWSDVPPPASGTVPAKVPAPALPRPPAVPSGVLPPPPPSAKLGALPPPAPGRDLASAKARPAADKAPKAPPKASSLAERIANAGIADQRVEAPSAKAAPPPPETTEAEPRGAWDDLLDAPDSDPDATWSPEAPKALEVEHVDMDHLVRDLSEPPPPKAASWELPPAPMPLGTPPPAPIESRSRRAAPAWVWPTVAVVTYILGVGTPFALGLTSSQPAAPSVEPTTAASSAPSTETPAPDAPVAAAEPLAGPEPTESETAEPEPAIEPGTAEPETAVEPSPAVTQGEPETHLRAVRRAPRRPTEEPVARATETHVAPEVEQAPAHTARPARTPRETPSIETPGREDVQHAMAGVQRRIEACATPADRGQRAQVRFTFGSDGRPVHTMVSGVAGATASCIAREARTVRLPAFSRDRFVVEFPFQL